MFHVNVEREWEERKRKKNSREGLRVRSVMRGVEVGKLQSHFAQVERSETLHGARCCVRCECANHLTKQMSERDVRREFCY